MKVKVDTEKVGLKVNIQKIEIMASYPMTSWQNDRKILEILTHFIFLAPKLWQMVTAAMKLKDSCSLEENL